MSVENNKKLSYPYTEEELKNIFNNVKPSTMEELKKVYMPYLKHYANRYELSSEDANNLYETIFANVYNDVLQGKQNPGSFGKVLINKLFRECLNKHILSNSETVNNSAADKEAKCEFINIIPAKLDEIDKSKELIDRYNILPIEIALLRDYCELFKECYKTNKLKQVSSILAEKYQITEMEVNAWINSGVKKIRQMKELGAFETTQNLNK